jgi:hypothetical protein
MVRDGGHKQGHWKKMNTILSVMLLLFLITRIARGESAPHAKNDPDSLSRREDEASARKNGSILVVVVLDEQQQEQLSDASSKT